MIEVKSFNLRKEIIINEFNKKSKNWKAIERGMWTMPFNIYCKCSLKIKERKLFGYSFDLNYWDGSGWEIKVWENYDISLIKEPINLFEEIIKDQIFIERC